MVVFARIWPRYYHDDEITGLFVQVFVGHRWLEQITIVIDPLL
jgi:hypothetical protein